MRTFIRYAVTVVAVFTVVNGVVQADQVVNATVVQKVQTAGMYEAVTQCQTEHPERVQCSSIVTDPKVVAVGPQYVVVPVVREVKDVVVPVVNDVVSVPTVSAREVVTMVRVPVVKKVESVQVTVSSTVVESVVA
jgi:hypothetical protein